MVKQYSNVLIILVYYNTGLSFVVLAIISAGYDNIALTKIIAESWECSNITARSNENMSAQTIIRVVNEPTVLLDWRQN